MIETAYILQRSEKNACMLFEKGVMNMEASVIWFDNYLGWLERLVTKLRKLLEKKNEAV